VKLICALLAGTAVAAGDEPATPKLVAGNPVVQAQYERGIALFLDKSYGAAAAELAQAFRGEPHREILFAWAQSERLRGNCASAIDLYQRYLRDNPESKLAPLVTHHLRGCQEVVRPPWYKDALGDVLAGSGIAALGVGIGFLIPSVANETARNAALNEDDYVHFQDSARTERIVAITCLSAGAALIASSILRYRLRGRVSNRDKIVSQSP
jgi:hypothetical protein